LLADAGLSDQSVATALLIRRPATDAFVPAPIGGRHFFFTNFF